MKLEQTKTMPGIPFEAELLIEQIKKDYGEIYIGRTCDLKKRCNNHHEKNKYTNMKPVYITTQKETIIDFEKWMIKTFNPNQVSDEGGGENFDSDPNDSDCKLYYLYILYNQDIQDIQDIQKCKSSFNFWKAVGIGGILGTGAFLIIKIIMKNIRS